MTLIGEAERSTLEGVFVELQLIKRFYLGKFWPWNAVLPSGMARSTAGAGVDVFVIEQGYNTNHGLLQNVNCFFSFDEKCCHLDDEYGGHGSFVLG